MSPLLRRAGARLAAAAALAAVVLASSLAAAAPAGAQVEPGRDGTGARIDAGVAAVLRALLADRSDLDVELAAADRVEAPASCAEVVAADARVEELVAEIFRCRLTEAGVPWDETVHVAAEALVVAHCESRFDTTAVVFDGRYRDVPHPNGNRYSAAGVFQFIRKTADDWIDGGYAHVHDARRNVDAAARLYIHNRTIGLRGWEDWACAAVNDGFKQGGSVLPGWPGGPAALPDWAFNY